MQSDHHQSGDGQSTTMRTRTRSVRDAAAASRGPLGIEENLIPISEGEFVGVAYLATPCIREHQACLLEERLRGLAERCHGRLAVSLGEVEDISSAGINALVAVHAQCRQYEQRLAVFGLSRDLRSLFKLTHLDRTIVIAADANQAVRSFRSPAGRWRWFSSRRNKAA